MPIYVPYTEERQKEESAPPSRYTPYVDDGTSAPKPQLDTAPAQQEPNAGTEAGKGAVRGLAEMGQTVANILPGVTVGGQPVNPLQNPIIQKMAENFSGLMGRNPDASPEQHAWGTAGEIAGSAAVGGMGGKMSLFDKAAPKVAEAVQAAPQQLSALQELIVDRAGGALGTAAGHLLGAGSMGGTIGRMIARYGVRATMKALQKIPEGGAAGGGAQYSGGGLSPEAIARISAAGAQPLFSQGEQ